MILIAHWIAWGIISEVVRDLGIAVVIASILGITIYRWIKGDIVNDAFEAALGGLFPEDFRDEVRRLMGYNLVCESHHLEISIKLSHENTVRVETKIERHIKNIGKATAETRPFLHADEWGFEEKTIIIESKIILEDGTTIKGEPTPTTGSRLLYSGESCDIKSGHTYKSVSRFSETRRNNDIVTFHFMTPTRNPVIEIEIDRTLDHFIEFGTANEKWEKAEYSNRYTLKGTYFPHQKMTVRWWPKTSN